MADIDQTNQNPDSEEPESAPEFNQLESVSAEPSGEALENLEPFNEADQPVEFAGVTPQEEVSDQDKLMGLLAYVITIIVPLIILLSETGKKRPFQRYHAVHSLIISGIILIFGLVIICPITVGVSLISAGIGSCCTVPFGLIPYIIGVVYGIQAYGGRYVEIPLVTNLAKSQGWV